MPIDAKKSRLIFRKLARELTKLTKKPAPENVHSFRTNSRRVEALLMEIVPDHHRNDDKLLRLLAQLRKKAGRVRDLDVQIAALRNFKVPVSNGDKSQLMDALIGERDKREKKLAKAFDHKTAAEIHKRLKRSARGMHIPRDTEPLALTLGKLAQLGRDHVPVTEKVLHQYRIIGKRARYVAELAGQDPAAKRVVEQLKHMQDVIGDWHDWLKLSQKAEELLGDVRDSSLVAMLQSVTQAKFRQSLNAVAEMRAALPANGFSLRRQPAASHKPSAKEAPARSAAA